MWFDEQVRQRKLKDAAALENALRGTADVIWKEVDSSLGGKADFAICEILKYYNKPVVEIPSDISNLNNQLEYCMHPYGIMFRRVSLTPQWYKDSFGPILVLKKDSGKAVSLFPSKFSSYYYTDEETGKKIYISEKNSDELEKWGICFYRPLPNRKMNFASLRKFAWSLTSPSDVVRALAALIVATVIGLMTPRLSHFIFSHVDQMDSISLLLSTMLMMISISLANLMFSAVKDLYISRIENEVGVQLESAMMMRVLSFSPSFFRNYSSGDLASRIDYTREICTGVVSGIISAFFTGMFSLAYFSQIGQFTPYLILPAVTALLLSVIVSFAASFRSIKYRTQALGCASKNNGVAFSIIDGIQKIKLTGSEKRIFAKWAKGFREQLQETYNIPSVLKLKNVIVTAIGLVGQIWFFYRSAKNGADAASYYSFIVSFGIITAAFAELGTALESISNIRSRVALLKPLLETTPENSESRKVVTKLRGNIEFTRVSFGYEPNQKVVDDMSFKVKAGEYVAIVGKTGCGKSTIVRLLLGFEVPEFGSIFFDRHDISKVDVKSVRRLIGTVMQENKLMFGSIMENILISAPEKGIDDAWKAAEIAGIADDIRKMPMGMFTMVSEGDNGISGGQRQRILIARALVNNPRILIFDEATSALDNITQKKISDAIDELDCTRIVIAHRLSTIRHADRIMYLDDGKILEEGTYDELIEKNGLFAKLVERQRLES